MARRLVTAIALSLLALTSCRDLTFHSVCETTPSDPRCRDDVGSPDADATGDTSGCASGDKRCVGPKLQKCSASLTGWDDVGDCLTAELCASSPVTGCTAPACSALAPKR